MRRIDLHTHTYFCDGENSPEEMVLSAIEKGLDVIGILAHSFVQEDPEGSMPIDKQAEFISTVNELKEKYKNKIEVRVGIEMDMYSRVDTTGFDYIIGSCHYVKKDGKLRAIDISEDDFISTVKELFDGDYESAYEWYYNSLSELKNRTNADIAGHIDLITKYNDGNKYFDTYSEKYVNSYKKAVEKLVEDGLVFEVNTGGMHKYKSEPYPSKQIREYIKQRGGKLMLSSDAHKKEDIAFLFDRYKNEV
ncbi:MAG: histidinol-phosphatase [Clostridia bacterium]|nr:histidinol-phosphatase [Clostridia bacterium]